MTSRLRAAVLLLAAAAAGSAFAAPEAPADPLEPLRASLERQDRLAEGGQFDALVSEARTAARDGRPETYFLLGRALGNSALARREKGDAAGFQSLLDESQRCFECAKESGIAIFPPALLGLARCHRLRAELAIVEAEAAASKGDAAARDAQLAVGRKAIESAVGLLDHALTLSPGFKAASVDLAEVLIQVQRPADAETVLRRQLALRPADPELRILLGMTKLSAEKLVEAEQEFRAALKADPESLAAHKLLASVLVRRDLWEEAASHFETCRLLRPKDEEVYRLLFVARVKLRDRSRALATLEAAQKALPGTATAEWAAARAAEYAADPDKFEKADERTPQGLAKKLESKDPKAQLEALEAMRTMKWPALPGAVYRILAPDAAPSDVRRAAVALIAEQEDPRTISILEILLFHPREQDPDGTVRREAAKALARIRSHAIVPILWRALDVADVETREAAVRGIRAVTGKSFRVRDDVMTGEAEWPAERQLYDAFWRTQAAASVWRKDAYDAMAQVFEPIRTGRRRLAQYTLDGLTDASPRTWRAAYDLFRALTGQTFGFESGEVSGTDRRSVADQCREWFLAHGNED